MNKQIRAMITLDEDEVGLEETEQTMEETTTPEEAVPTFQLYVQAVRGTSAAGSTFTLTLRIGKGKATALVDT